MNKGSLITGIILIALGGLILSDNLGLINFDWEDLIFEIGDLWPWLLIGGGALFWVGWMRNRSQYGMLLPGTILVTYGILFWYCQQFGWWHMGEYNLWAFFILGPGLGFLAMYFLGSKDNGYLVPATILLAIGGISLSGPYNWRLFWPVILILIGIRLLFKNRGKGDGASAAG